MDCADDIISFNLNSIPKKLSGREVKIDFIPIDLHFGSPSILFS